MKLWSNTFKDGDRIPERCAFGKHNAHTHVELSENKNPHFAWSDVPTGAKSLVLICHDSDVPSQPDDVNKDGRTVSASLPRVDFFHWVLVDIDPKRTEILEGEFSNGITPRGKNGPDAGHGMRHGINDYTQWFSGDESMAGDYFGYDGPCPPWNDEIVHHYHFTLYATDLDRCPVGGKFSGRDVLDAIHNHILAEARITGLYAINPSAR